jgi:tail protein
MPTIFREGVTVGGLHFNAPEDVSGSLQAWGIDVMDGWENTPDPEVLTTEFSNSRDGSVSADFWPIRARFITIGGYVKCTTRAEALKMQTLIVSSFPRNKDFFIIREETPAKTVTARRASGFEFDWPMPDGFRWQTTVRCDDPLKYSVDVVDVTGGAVGLQTGGFTFPLQFPLTFPGSSENSGGIGVFNAGSVASPRWAAVISGPLTRGGWRLRNETNDGEISFDTAVLQTDILIIDFWNRAAYLNDYPISANITGDWFSLEPGNNTIRLFAEYSSAISVLVHAYSAWE